MFRKLEREGVLTPNRQDFLSAATVYLLEFLVSAKGIPFDELHDHLQREYWNVCQLPPETQEEKEEKIANTNEAFFSALKNIYGTNEEAEEKNGRRSR